MENFFQRHKVYSPKLHVDKTIQNYPKHKNEFFLKRTRILWVVKGKKRDLSLPQWNLLVNGRSSPFGSENL